MAIIQDTTKPAPVENDSLTVRQYSVEVSNDRMAIFRTKIKREGKKGRTSNWNIVITILQCAILNVKRIHIVVAARLIFALLGFLDTTVHLSNFELAQARDRSTVIAFTKMFPLRISRL